MRVISGTARGKKLNTLSGLNTRPTLDRVKEAVFSIIQFDLEDENVLDLFSGSGALAIEALSRGAKNAVMCDNSYEAIKIIKQNVKETRLIDKVEIINKDYAEALKKLNKENKKFDIIFLDPPYKSDFAIKSMEYIFRNNMLLDDGIIIFETDDKNKEQEILKYKEMRIFDIRKYGSVYVIFIRKG